MYPTVNINEVFDFKKYTEENFIYAEIGLSEQTSRNFMSVPTERTIRGVLINYVIEEKQDYYFPEELLIDVKSSYIEIGKRADSVHYKGDALKVNYYNASVGDSFKIAVDDAAFERTFFINYTTFPTFSQVMEAIKNVEVNPYNLNQINVSNQLEQINADNFITTIQPKLNSNIYRGFATINIKRTQPIEKLITCQDIGFVKLRGDSNTENPELIDIQEAVASHNPNGCDANVATHLVFETGDFTATKIYERKVNLKFDNEYSAHIFGAIEVSMVCTIANTLIYKYWDKDMTPGTATENPTPEQIENLDWTVAEKNGTDWQKDKAPEKFYNDTKLYYRLNNASFGAIFAIAGWDESLEQMVIGWYQATSDYVVKDFSFDMTYLLAPKLFRFRAVVKHFSKLKIGMVNQYSPLLFSNSTDDNYGIHVNCKYYHYNTQMQLTGVSEYYCTEFWISSLERKDIYLSCNEPTMVMISNKPSKYPQFTYQYDEKPITIHLPKLSMVQIFASKTYSDYTSNPQIWNASVNYIYDNN